MFDPSPRGVLVHDKNDDAGGVMGLATLVLNALRTLPARRPAAVEPRPATPSTRSLGIDYPGFRRVVERMAEQRDERRLNESEFIAAMDLPGTVVLDARSPTAFARRHVRGAINLPLTDFHTASLAAAIPSKRTPLLIYCNNNFSGDDHAFPAQVARAALSLSTWTTLRAYGYCNLFELAGRHDVRRTRIPLS
jgi:rhodanese-related sulfurtransferase